MYAIFETGGKQYTAKVGDVLFIEKLNANVDETVIFEKVLAVGDAAMTFGTPYVEGVTVSGKVLKNGKGKKITVMTYRPKKDSKRKMGHRQPYTKVEITAVGAVAEEKPAAKKAAAPKAEGEKKPATKKAAAPKAEGEKKPAAKKAAAPKAEGEKKPAAKKAAAPKAEGEKKPAAKKTAAKKTEEKGEV
ncbi:MAG: 50S ribosomal protein L21 [Angelakisella sp.]|nr:50S ribosomal protein L21 [Angelakisella sp.]